MKDGDIYHWCDVGCHFNLNGKSRLKEYIKMTSNDPAGFLGFQYKDPEFINEFPNYKFLNYMEYEYTKADLVKYFNISHQDKIMLSPQVWGGMFFFKKSPNIDKFIDKVKEAVFNGRMVLLEELTEEIDPGLSSIIAKELKKEGGEWVINIGGVDVDYNE